MNFRLLVVSLLCLVGSGCSDTSVGPEIDTSGANSGNEGLTSGNTTTGNEGADSGSADTGNEGADSGSADTGNEGAVSGGTDTGSEGLGNGANTPNFLFIISDDQGIDASAQYSVGQDLPNTPIINALADQGIIFDNAWATPSCTTTRGSIISGQHGINSGVTATPTLMDPNTLTLQRLLTNSGSSTNYATAVVGKWHLAGGNTENQLSHPNESGVEYYAGNISGTVESYNNWPLTENGITTISQNYHTTEVTDIAIDWVGQQVQPWFLWLAYVSPHSPFHLPPSNLHTRTLSGDASDIENNPRPYYLAAIEAMDSEIGRLLNSLDEGTRDNTLIVFLGDNGTPRAVIDPAVYERAHGKNSLYEGGIRVPMVVAGLGVTRQNERESALVNTVDLFATVSEAAGLPVPAGVDGQSFLGLLKNPNAPTREYNYSEFVSSATDGWTVRNADLKLIQFADGTRELFHLRDDPREVNNLINDTASYSNEIAALAAFAAEIRSVGSRSVPAGPVDITGATLTNQSVNCSDYVNTYTSNATDVQNNTNFNGQLTIALSGDHCEFSTNAIPNHDFNDASRSFPNTVSAQADTYRVAIAPQVAAAKTALSLTDDNAILLNGVKVDILGAGCFGVGNGKIGCNDTSQPWRYDPANPSAGFLIDSHNAHTQPDGTYHYHGEPKALFSSDDVVKSPVVGFAADGFPIFGSFFDDNGAIREVQPSYRLKSGLRPTGAGQPGGTYDGTFRDDYEYVSGLGDLDECNGVLVDGDYRYHITKQFPYVLGCFSGTPDESFSKRN